MSIVPAFVVAALVAAACGSSSKAVRPLTSTTSEVRTVVQAAAYNVDLSTFATALNIAGTVDRLSRPGPFTVFAPNNEAFSKLSHRRLTALLSTARKRELGKILNYHVVAGRHLAKNLGPGRLKTLSGAFLTVIRRGKVIELRDAHGNRAQIVRADIVTPNGVIDIIDHVLLPPG